MLFRRARGGFTLIELIVVMVMLGVLAGLVLPRALGGSWRAAQAEASQVRVLVESALRRARGSTADGLRVVFEPGRDGGRGGGVGGGGGGEFRVEVLDADGAWVGDLLMPAIRLERAAVVSARLGGVALGSGGGGWNVSLGGLGEDGFGLSGVGGVRGGARAGGDDAFGLLLVEIGEVGGARRWVVEGDLTWGSVRLLPGGLVGGGGRVGGGGGRDRRVDLDGGGREDSAW